LAVRRLGFISTGAAEYEETCTEYLDLLYAPGEEKACLQALTPFLSQPGMLGWDELHLSDLPSTSPLLALKPHFKSLFLRVEASSSGPCHLFSMEEGYEAYLQRLSHENRRQARKMLRDVVTEGMEFEVAADRERLHLFFDQMVELHRARWTAVGKAGSFSPHHAQFHRLTAERLLQRGEAVIARLAHAGRPLAVAFGYRCRERLHCYQQGVALGVGRMRSPGTAVWLLLMVDQAERGVTVFDHMTGSTQFKERFATDLSPLAELRVRRLGLRMVAHSVVNWVCRAVGRGRRLLSGVRAGTRGRIPAEASPVVSPQASAQPTVVVPE
jgi:CelD/BcsL family acetyltransferase involved in cellulose biosynthesis